MHHKMTPIVHDIDDVTHSHNEWEIVRSKKDLTTVRCRVCQYQVKMHVIRRCGGFSSKQQCGSECCSDMHVYHQKMSLEERVQTCGSFILSKVPSSMLRRRFDSTSSQNSQNSRLSMSASSITSMGTRSESCLLEEPTAEPSVPEPVPVTCVPRPFVLMGDDGSFDVHWVDRSVH
eukprot:TRINITY_DN30167_c0_g1_i1.p1 TRINITY_DN30167_c0_g1~~TRINITY_DN30167_c0_g1_i1.p1  ORF type:complete len:175 (+),score=28.69 TRINITY_DN30167_c0_g1_i1:45-569(+)